jgi:hypothetical protein
MLTPEEMAEYIIGRSFYRGEGSEQILLKMLREPFAEIDRLRNLVEAHKISKDAHSLLRESSELLMQSNEELRSKLALADKLITTIYPQEVFAAKSESDDDDEGVKLVKAYYKIRGEK